MSELTYRRLPEEEFGRLAPLYELYGEPMPVPRFTVPYVAERDEKIVGVITGEQVVSVSMFHVEEAYRGLGVAERLAFGGYKLLPEGMTKEFITRNRHVELVAHRMGFKPMVGQLWVERGHEK
jgi:GNAT superfamily N-acetyltransferase